MNQHLFPCLVKVILVVRTLHRISEKGKTHLGNEVVEEYI